MKFEIQQWNNNKILRTKSSPINQNEFKKYVKIWNDMIKYIKDPENGWVWLAANQIWLNKRIIVVSLLKDRDDENFKTLMMLNPEILEHSEETDMESEWCLSIPWEKAEVERYLKIKLRYRDDKFKEQILYLEWVPARILQHEIDHLDWILFIDKSKMQL